MRFLDCFFKRKKNQSTIQLHEDLEDCFAEDKPITEVIADLWDDMDNQVNGNAVLTGDIQFLEFEHCHGVTFNLLNQITKKWLLNINREDNSIQLPKVLCHLKQLDNNCSHKQQFISLLTFLTLKKMTVLNSKVVNSTEYLKIGLNEVTSFNVVLSQKKSSQSLSLINLPKNIIRNIATYLGPNISSFNKTEKYLNFLIYGNYKDINELASKRHQARLDY